MHADSLEADLWDHLHWWLSQYPGPERRASRWVMDVAWLCECRKIAITQGYWAFCPPPTMTTPERLLGVPVDIRDHDDRPGWMWRVPHLEPVAP